MDKIILEKAIKQAKANVELETSTPINEKIIRNCIENVINKQIEKKGILQLSGNREKWFIFHCRSIHLARKVTRLRPYI